mgnify:CR=1 FL=1
MLTRIIHLYLRSNAQHSIPLPIAGATWLCPSILQTVLDCSNRWIAGRTSTLSVPCCRNAGPAASAVGVISIVTVEIVAASIARSCAIRWLPIERPLVHVDRSADTFGAPTHASRRTGIATERTLVCTPPCGPKVEMQATSRGAFSLLADAYLVSRNRRTDRGLSPHRRRVPLQRCPVSRSRPGTHKPLTRNFPGEGLVLTGGG